VEERGNERLEGAPLRLLPWPSPILAILPQVLSGHAGVRGCGDCWGGGV